MAHSSRQQLARTTSQLTLFALFILAPPLDLLRMDLQHGHAVLLGMKWILGNDALLWVVVIITYLLPPAEIYTNQLHAQSAQETA